MRKAVPLLAVLLLAAACGGTPHSPQASVEDAVVTLPAVAGRPGAAYFTVRTNHESTRLTGITSPRVGRIELHETVQQGGVSQMRPVADASVSPDAPLIFEPGGRHAMLFEMDPALRACDRLSLDFRFDGVPAVSVEAEVRAPGQAHRNH